MKCGLLFCTLEDCHACCLQSDELSKICDVIGSPTNANWPWGLELAAALGFSFAPVAPKVCHRYN